MRRMALMSHHEHEDLLNTDLDVHYLLENPDREPVIESFYLDTIKTICPRSQTFSQSSKLTFSWNKPSYGQYLDLKKSNWWIFCFKGNKCSTSPKGLQFWPQLCVNCALKFLSTSLCVQRAKDVALLEPFTCTAHPHWPHTGCEVVWSAVCVTNPAKGSVQTEILPLDCGDYFSSLQQQGPSVL